MGDAGGGKGRWNCLYSALHAASRLEAAASAGQETIAWRVGKVLNCFKMGKHFTLVIHHAHQKQSVGWCRRPGVSEETQVQRQLNELQDGKRVEGTGR